MSTFCSFLINHAFPSLCHAMACFCVISYIQISLDITPCVHFFIWILPLLGQLLSAIAHYDITMGNDIDKDAHCNITMGNDVAMHVHC